MATKSVNKVILIGNLGQDPELRFTGAGVPVCSMRLATSESYKDNDDNWVEKTEWHSIVAWRRLAEICSEYLRKGSKIYVEGSLQTRSWEDRDGNTRYTTEVTAREMVMLDPRGGNGGFGGGQSSVGMGSPAQSSGTANSSGPSDGDGFDVDDDLPF